MLKAIAQKADGDARKALNLLDACCSYVLHSEKKCGSFIYIMSRELSLDMVDANMSQRFVRYDKNGEEHYNIASAFQKSIVCLLNECDLSEEVTSRPHCIGWAG